MSRAAKEDAACMKKGGAANFIQKAVKKPGQLHKDLGVPMGDKIPKAKIKAAASKPGKVGQRARFAETLGTLKKAKGGSAKHSDAKADAKQIKSMVKPAALKSANGPMPAKFAAGGVARARLGGSTMDGQQKKPSGPMKSPIGKVTMPKRGSGGMI